MSTLRLPLFIFIIVTLSLTGFYEAHADDYPRIWVLVDTKTLTLTVFSAHRVVARFRNIALGSGGTAQERWAGDEKTPLGRFRVAWIDWRSRFGIFFGLNYPTPVEASRAYLRNRISWADYRAIVAAARARRTPPQNTPLGGQIGIHGVGAGNPLVQRDINWTDGCIALSNRQIKSLALWVHIGTEVIIR